MAVIDSLHHFIAVTVADKIVALGVATAAQFFLGYGWTVLVAKPWSRALAMDKGVKSVEGIKARYSMGLCLAASVMSYFLHAMIVIGLLAATGTLGRKDLASHLVIGAAGSLITAVDFAGELWKQRPLPLLVLDRTCDLLYYLTASACLYWL
jgi:preprotein translocase subunit SecY